MTSPKWAASTFGRMSLSYISSPRRPVSSVVRRTGIVTSAPRARRHSVTVDILHGLAIFGQTASPISYTGTDRRLLTAGPLIRYARDMSVSDQELLHHISRMPFVDTAELAMITGEAHVCHPPGLDRPAVRGHRRAGQPRHVPSAVQQAVLPDGPGRRRSRQSPGLRHALGLRAGLPGAPGVAHLAHPPDGRGSLHLPPGGVPVPRHRRAAYAGGFSTAGAGSTPLSPGTTGSVSAWCARAWACAAAPSTTGCGPSRSTSTGAAPARSWS